MRSGQDFLQIMEFLWDGENLITQPCISVWDILIISPLSCLVPMLRFLLHPVMARRP